MKALAIVALAVALEAGFLFTLAVPARAAVAQDGRAAQVELARAPAPVPARS
ncbi:conserved hypothetical protein [Anaeromyxobacter dehalogenans 2CP-1]|uniref:Uncharacterized protein n=1 Tax=Anaeromyxobacter dehalogenans (strain ATCC BAA-258 / DSM 21875 / 2CP-1) TaxID=455488 RepID=B8JH70_ANAD2|nr:hypothetical protein [Anaeromyxobacter dehalogenans]ACL64772.1 conserved hypothetical protein [Anaeromyxobacter dehalogenans 2CP-1]